MSLPWRDAIGLVILPFGLLDVKPEGTASVGRAFVATIAAYWYSAAIASIVIAAFTALTSSRDFRYTAIELIMSNMVLNFFVGILATFASMLTVMARTAVFYPGDFLKGKTISPLVFVPLPMTLVFLRHDYSHGWAPFLVAAYASTWAIFGLSLWKDSIVKKHDDVLSEQYDRVIRILDVIRGLRNPYNDPDKLRLSLNKGKYKSIMHPKLRRWVEKGEIPLGYSDSSLLEIANDARSDELEEWINVITGRHHTMALGRSELIARHGRREYSPYWHTPNLRSDLLGSIRDHIVRRLNRAIGDDGDLRSHDHDAESN